MPSYNFKEQFVPYVTDGSKHQTVRARNKKNQIPKVETTLYLFYGLRTKYTKRLREEVCTKVEGIFIDSTRIVTYDQPLDQIEISIALHAPLSDRLKGKKWLSNIERARFAWADGFRPEGTTYDEPGNAFEYMLSFWDGTHSLPFVGDIIHWKPKK